MSGAIGGPGGAGGARGLDPAHAKLRKLSQDLEGVFLGQLFQAMRATVPQGESSDPGREMFTSMLDDTVAREAATHMRGGISDALYRQLSRHLPPNGGAPAAPAAPAAPMAVAPTTDERNHG